MMWFNRQSSNKAVKVKPIRAPQLTLGAYTVTVKNGVLIAEEYISSGYYTGGVNLYSLDRQGIVNEVIDFTNVRGKRALAFANKVADYVDNTR